MRRGQAPFFAPVRVVWNREAKENVIRPGVPVLLFELQ